MKRVTIQARKYSKQLHYEWDAHLIETNDSYSLVFCEAGRTFIHHSKQKQFTMPYPSLEWFFFDRGYTVAISFKPEGLMYYCNIALPASYEENIISFIDLDLDYLCEVDEEWKVVDEEEFALHQKTMNYDEQTVQFALQSLATLQQAVHDNSYPFSLKEAELKDYINHMINK